MDITPSEINAEQFACHLPAELEQLTLTKKRLGIRNDPQKPKFQEAEKPKISKLMKLEEEEKEEEIKSPPRKKEFREEKSKCKFYLSE